AEAGAADPPVHDDADIGLLDLPGERGDGLPATLTDIGLLLHLRGRRRRPPQGTAGGEAAAAPVAEAGGGRRGQEWRPPAAPAAAAIRHEPPARGAYDPGRRADAGGRELTARAGMRLRRARLC